MGQYVDDYDHLLDGIEAARKTLFARSLELVKHFGADIDAGGYPPPLEEVDLIVEDAHRFPENGSHDERLTASKQLLDGVNSLSGGAMPAPQRMVIAADLELAILKEEANYVRDEMPILR